MSSAYNIDSNRPPPQKLSFKQAKKLRYGFTCLDFARDAMTSNTEDMFFVFVDIEWYERDKIKDKCTEVGIAVLYKPATGVARLEKCTHLVISDMYSRRNGRHVADHKDDFNVEFGGTSTPIHSGKLAAAISEILTTVKSRGTTLLVVHGGSEDIQFLKRWKCNTDGMAILDTQDMQQAVDYEPKGEYFQGSSLSTILSSYGIGTRNLHNGANDACYTMQAFQAIAATEKGEFGDQDLVG